MHSHFGGNFSNLIFSLNFITVFPCHYMCYTRQLGEFRAAQKKKKSLVFPLPRDNNFHILVFYLLATFLSTIFIYLYKTGTMLHILFYRLPFLHKYYITTISLMSFKNLIINIWIIIKYLNGA